MFSSLFGFATEGPPSNFKYFSPGLQIGINNSKEIFFSLQLTLGYEMYGQMHPGITLGKRFYIQKKYQSYNFIDIQCSISYTWGAGLGMIFNQEEKYYKYKIYGGVLGLVSYDFIKFTNKPKHHFGLLGVFPIISESCDYAGCIKNYNNPRGAGYN